MFKKLNHLDDTPIRVYEISLTDLNVGPYAFAENKTLTKLTLGPKTSNIFEGAFKNCSNLKEVYITNVSYMIFVYPDSFEGNASNRIFYVPYNLQNDYLTNSIWKTYL